jgi:hypothetical protein
MNWCVFIVGFLLITLFIVYILTILANDIELEPGPFTMLKFGHSNVISLNNEDKFDELAILVKENNFHIFALTETWLNNSINSDSFHITGYNPIIRLDREGRIGGSVAILSVDSLVVKCRLDLEAAALEFLWIEFSTSGCNVLSGVIWHLCLIFLMGFKICLIR